MEQILKKPKSLSDIQQLQKYMDKTIEEKYDVREQDLVDVVLSCTAEIHEWAMELPMEKNFKTWAPRAYNSEAEFKEFVDILFFICKIANIYGLELPNSEPVECTGDVRHWALELNIALSFIAFSEPYEIQELIDTTVSCYITIAKARGLSMEDICNHYWDKYLYNLKRFC